MVFLTLKPNFFKVLTPPLRNLVGWDRCLFISEHDRLAKHSPRPTASGSDPANVGIIFDEIELVDKDKIADWGGREK